MSTIPKYVPIPMSGTLTDNITSSQVQGSSVEGALRFKEGTNLSPRVDCHKMLVNDSG